MYKSKYISAKKQYLGKYYVMKGGDKALCMIKNCENKNVSHIKSFRHFCLNKNCLNYSKEHMNKYYHLESIFDNNSVNVNFTNFIKIKKDSNDVEQLNLNTSLRDVINIYKSVSTNYMDDKYDDVKFNHYGTTVFHKLQSNYICNYILNYGKEFYESLSKKSESIRESIDDDKFICKKLNLSNSSKIRIIGDIHSSIHSLTQILSSWIDDKFIDENWKLPPNHYVIFLGDLVDRGPYSLEVLYVALRLFNNNRKNVVILNGNHEDKDVYKRYSFSKEIVTQLKSRKLSVWQILRSLPTILFIRRNDEIFCLCHGAIENNPEIKKQIIQFLASDSTIKVFDLTQSQILNSTSKWGDFSFWDHTSIDLKTNRIQFGKKDVKEYLDELGIKMIISGHQDMESYAILSDTIPTNYEKSKLYNLYVPDKKKNHIVPENTYAIVTSTATVPRKLSHNTYIEISS